MSTEVENQQTPGTEGTQPTLDPTKIYNQETPKEPEKKPDAEKKPEETKPETPAEKKPDAPVALTAADIKLPEGVTLDPKTSETLLNTLNDEKLSKGELASKLIDMQLQREKAAGEEREHAYEELQTKWQDACKTDKDFGGAKYDASVSGIGKVMAKYGDDDARAAFNLTGAGNNPAIFRMLSRMASVLTEAGLIGDGAPSNEKRSLEERIYTNTGSK